MTDTDKAYLAGLIDGEGTITLSRHHRGQSPQPRLAIANNSLALLEWVRGKTGCGGIIRRQPRGERHNVSYVWQACLAGAVLGVLREVRPYLVLKKEHADLLMEEYRGCTPRNGKYTRGMREAKDRLVARIRSLNQRGRSSSSITRQAPAASAAG